MLKAILLVALVGACAVAADSMDIRDMRYTKDCKGRCQYVKKEACIGSYVQGKCGGGDDIQCCQPKLKPAAPGVGAKCAANDGRTGVCMEVRPHACGGTFQGGLCPGGDNIKCCLAKIAAPVQPPTPTPVQPPTQTPVQPPAQQPPAQQPPTPAPAKKCKGGVGYCQSRTITCVGGSYKTGLCDGGEDNQCCFPNGGSAPPAIATVPEHQLPAFDKLWKAYPGGEAAEVKERIGGGVNAEYVTNTCVIRLSRTLNYAGAKLKTPFALKTGANMLVLSGGDKFPYALRVKEFKEYMLSYYGKPQIKHVNPGDGTEDVPAAFIGKRGIIMFDVRVWNDASGHFDLWDGTGDGRCGHDCYFDKAKEVWLWTL